MNEVSSRSSTLLHPRSRLLDSSRCLAFRGYGSLGYSDLMSLSSLERDIDHPQCVRRRSIDPLCSEAPSQPQDRTLCAHCLDFELGRFKCSDGSGDSSSISEFNLDGLLSSPLDPLALPRRGVLKGSDKLASNPFLANFRPLVHVMHSS